MEERKDRITVQQFQSVLDILDPSMDNFLFIYDVKNDYFCISASATERFMLEESQFHNVREKLDKLVHPLDKEALECDLLQMFAGKSDFHNQQYRWLGKDGKTVWINCRGQLILDEEGKPEFLIGCINEIGKRQKADNVCGLLRQEGVKLEMEKRAGARLNGFLMRISIDNFRDINNNRGFEYGDMVLRRTAECIQQVLEPHQKLFRIVADEFIIVDFAGSTVKKAYSLYLSIRWEIERFIEENGYEIFYTLSAGILELDKQEDQNYDNLSKLLEFALSEAKNRGRNQSYIFEQTDYDAFLRRRKLTRILRKAVNEDCKGFDTYFQPIVDIADGRLTMAETLLRFNTEETGFISPAEFIPLLEESGLIIPVGRWVLRRAMEACKRIQETIPNFSVSVNLSYIQILKSNVLADIQQGIQEFRLKPGSLIVELTESGMLETNECYKQFCNGLQECGVLLALDDFGTGYSNFRYLYELSPDTIKIDRSFTLKALGNEHEYGLLCRMVDMAHSINLKMCIEGIETKEELVKISKMEPDYIQGYYFGKPCPFDTFVTEHLTEK